MAEASSCCFAGLRRLWILFSQGGRACTAEAVDGSRANCRGLVVVIAGPTAAGKSDAAVALAERLATQGKKAMLISADSVQVYKGLNIGSNKPTLAEQERWPIHLVDWCDPEEPCTAGIWTREALRLIDRALALGEVPIVVGGSCMYLDWLVKGEPDAPKSDPDAQAGIWEELKVFQESLDWDGAISVLAAADPEKAAKILPNNWRALVRQLEVVRGSQKRTGRSCRSYDMRAFFLCPPDRQALFHRIDRRCLAMLRVGLLEEVAGLAAEGRLREDTPAATAIGYRQVLDYLTRLQPRDADVETFCHFVRGFSSATRNYARSQMHWFMKDKAFTWLLADPTRPEAVGAELARLIDLVPSAFLQQGEADGAVRDAQAAQAADMKDTFRSCLASGLPISREEIEELIVRADSCTRMIPSSARQPVAPASTELPELTDPGTVLVGKVYWPGKHQRWGWGHPLGKLHRQGLQLFEASGWQVVKESDATTVPVFCWPSRKAGDFAAYGAPEEPLPLIRPFPQEFTSRLDDKAKLAGHLAAAGHASIHPETWDAETFFESSTSEESGISSDSALWFLKHSLGVKGTSVSVHAGRNALLTRLEELGQKGRQGFIVQRAVAPPALRSGRKWVLRVHSLLHGVSDGSLHLYCHKDMISCEYGQPFTTKPEPRAAHVSSAAKMQHLPKPTLLADESLAQQVFTLAGRAFASVLEHAPRGPYTPSQAELCQVFGLDVIVDETDKAWLLEVNSYPASLGATL
eukprot:TRINITY_DN12735_c0_g1_i2.p1 TRINITY_DN12735_c0_g1~~TRINITY_DN12735_c0_g1_i2.p1  ORF type:complete len:750 (+),score=169.79 TRINITY_DN12735_c0_g1_i2:134-2383(+)